MGVGGWLVYLLAIFGCLFLGCCHCRPTGCDLLYIIGAISKLFKAIFTHHYGIDVGLVKGMQASYLFIGGCALCCSFACLLFYRFMKKQDLII
jgi:hypothetical protein